MKKADWIMIGAFAGALAVAMGAFGAHALKHKLDHYEITIYNKAVLYHMFHAIAILISGLIMKVYAESRAWISASLFLGGVLFFSGSLYLMSIFHIRGLGLVTPLGGLLFISGWINLAFSAGFRTTSR